MFLLCSLAMIPALDPDSPRQFGAVPPRPLGATSIWSVAETDALIAAWNEGAPPAALALRFETTTNAIYARVRTLRRHGVALAARRAKSSSLAAPSPVALVSTSARVDARQHRARRRCLTCGRRFSSSHIGNRICLECLEGSGLF
jgi:hypothetical protein